MSTEFAVTVLAIATAVSAAMSAVAIGFVIFLRRRNAN